MICFYLMGQAPCRHPPGSGHWEMEAFWQEKVVRESILEDKMIPKSVLGWSWELCGRNLFFERNPLFENKNRDSQNLKIR